MGEVGIELMCVWMGGQGGWVSCGRHRSGGNSFLGFQSLLQSEIPRAETTVWNRLKGMRAALLGKSCTLGLGTGQRATHSG